MIIPSCIQFPDDKAPQVEEEVDGMYSLLNAYAGDYQEFFKGRLTSISVPTNESAHMDDESKVRTRAYSLVDQRSP